MGLALCCLGHALAEVTPRIRNVRFVNYGISDGLSQASALSMVQDSSGFLWIGTQDGLNRFAGYGFKAYRHHRGQRWSLADNHVTALAAGSDGVIWVGTQSGGLDRYDPVYDRFHQYSDASNGSASPSKNQVAALLVDHRGWLWVAFADGMLQWLGPSNHTLHETPLGKPPELGLVRVMRELKDGSILIGTRDGLWRCDSNASHLQPMSYAPGQTLDVQSVAIGPNDEIWVTTTSSGLFRFNPDGTPAAHYFQGANKPWALPDNELRGLDFDREGRLWIASKSSGLLRLDPRSGRLESFRRDAAQPGSLAADRQQSVLVDHDGLVWSGSWNNGLSVHDPRTEAFSTIEWVDRDAQGVRVLPVNAVTSGADDTLWFGLAGQAGLVQYDPARGLRGHYRHQPGVANSLTTGNIEHLLHSRDGSIWIVTDGGGLSQLLPGTSHFVNRRHDPDDPDTLASDHVLNIMQSRDGTLWIATADSGLDELCNGCTKFRHHRHDPILDTSIGPGAVSTLLEDDQGYIWVGLGTSGLDRYDRAQNRFTHFVNRNDDPNSLSNDAVTVLVQDRNKRLWIGTQGGGLNQLLSTVPPRFRSITTADGLAADAIGSIVEDQQGGLWLSTTRGISRYQPGSGQITNFDAVRGALSRGYYIDAFTQLADGKIVFAGLGGATLFDPSHIGSLPSPRPVITGMLVNNEPVSQSLVDPGSPARTSPWVSNSEIVTDYRQNNVSFQFGTTDFADPNSIDYEYRLIGHDLNWIKTNVSKRFAIYTDLEAGSYRLEVRARRDGTQWSPATTLKVRVLPAPWLSPLALSGYLIGLLIILGITGWRTRRDLAQRTRAREAIRLSEARLKYALWGSGGELWDLDLDSGKIFRENRLDEIAASHGAREETVVGYRQFVHPQDLPEVESAFRAHIKGERDFLEVSFRTAGRNGEWRWLLTRGRVVERDANGRAHRLVGTNHDITLLKRTEESLRKLNEELESRVDARTADLQTANNELRQTLEKLTLARQHLLESEKMAALGGLVAGVAHEINTPLGVTVTAASHLQEEARRMARLVESGELGPSELQRFGDTAQLSAQIILRNLRRADRLVRSFKLIAVDQTTEEPRDIEIGAYCSEILISLGPALKKSPHKVSVECNQPVQMHTYPGALYQIVTNLIMNSLTHGLSDDQRGEIVIEVTRKGSSVLIRYRDNGRGMDEAVRAHVFEPFFTTRRGTGGSGLGMHVVYNLVTQLLKGSIRVESAPGEGTMFEMVLPAPRVKTEPPAN